MPTIPMQSARRAPWANPGSRLRGNDRPAGQAVRFSTLALALGLAFPALAQQVPDAGQVLQETLPPSLQAPRPAPGVSVQPSAEAVILPGGQTVTLAGVKFSGNSIFTEAQLLAVLGEVKGQAFDLAGLRSLASRVSEHYRANGYPFARALVPAQNFADGVLTLQIVEGRYGEVQAQGEQSAAAQGFLADLKPGAVIESAALERATLILYDQPGIQVVPIIRPGQEPGTGDLVVNVSREPMFKGEVGLDNHGNRYTGAARLRFNAQADSPFTLGDQITLRTLYTEEGMWLGSAGYSLPLGASGLRGQVGYAHTYYELGEDFATLGAHGTARVTNAGLSYPILRSQKSNLTVGATFQHKQLDDRQKSTSTRNDKQSDSLPISLQFDHRDGLGGGGISFGSLAYTKGRLKLDDTLEAADIASNTNTRGSFDKWNLNLARVQRTGIPNLSLYGRLSAQWAGKNLDSSEGMSLGGANGVRAYPLGEGTGDEGWLVQLEARYAMGAWAPYLFHDAGRVRINAEPGAITPAVTDNTRAIAGSGLGLRYDSGPWNAEAAVAWRSKGGRPTSDTRDDNPRLWVSAGYRF